MYLSVEKSADSTHFSELYRQVGNSMMPGGCAFTFEDKALSNQKNYYRIKVMDLDGAMHISPVIGVLAAEIRQETLSLLQNPVRDDAVLVISAPRGGAVGLQVYSISGVLLQTRNLYLSAGSNQINMNTRALAAGEFVVKAIFSDGQTKALLLIKR
jgi:hypothetical protein